MARRGAYPIVITLDLLLAGTAIIGGIFIVPSLPVTWLEGSPITSFFFPALALTLIGMVSAIGAIELACERPLGIVASLAAGASITMFEIAQIALPTLGGWPAPFAIAVGHQVIPAGAGLHPAMYLAPIYVAIGLAIALWSCSLYRAEVASEVRRNDGRTEGSRAA
jgi:hypothetical protein